MAQKTVSAWIVAAILCWSWAATARAQSCASCPSAASARDPDLELIPMRPPLEGPSDLDLKVQLAVGLGVTAVGYVLGGIVAHEQQHSNALVDGIPIVGAVSAAARTPVDGRTAPVLLVSAGIQAIGILIAVASGVELVQQARFRVDVGCSTVGGNIQLTWRY